MKPAPFSTGLSELAAQVLQTASTGVPADRGLREFFREHPRLHPSDRTWISRAVFTYHRWLGWLTPNLPLRQQVEEALKWAAHFQQQPDDVSPTELQSRAVPFWVRSEMRRVPVAWLRSLQREPVLWIRAQPGQSERVLAALGGDKYLQPGRLPDAWRYQGKEDLFRHPEFASGLWEIQDIASQAVGVLAQPQPGEHWWDVCAGEGGKTLHIAQQMDGRGLVWATDRVGWRLERLRRRAARAKCFNLQFETREAEAALPGNRRFDGVLIDAPCSGLGTWGRNPHARWTTGRKDIAELVALQRTIVSGAVRGLKSGGRLIYAVCTLTDAETVGMAEWIGRTHPFLKPEPVRNPFVPKKGRVTDSKSRGVEAKVELADDGNDKNPSSDPESGSDVEVNQQLWWPHETGGNGMFVAMWRRE